MFHYTAHELPVQDLCVLCVCLSACAQQVLHDRGLPAVSCILSPALRTWPSRCPRRTKPSGLCDRGGVRSQTLRNLRQPASSLCVRCVPSRTQNRDSLGLHIPRASRKPTFARRQLTGHPCFQSMPPVGGSPQSLGVAQPQGAVLTCNLKLCSRKWPLGLCDSSACQRHPSPTAPQIFAPTPMALPSPE